MSRFLIAGGSGFVGSNLVKHLLAENQKVMVIDDFSTSNQHNLPRSHPGLILLKADICHISPYGWDFQEGFEYVINLACPASPIHYQKTPIKTLDACYIGTKNLLEIANRSKATFLQASTSEIYGDPLVHPQPEWYWGNVNTYGPRSCYDEGKRVAETLVHEYQKLGLSTRVIRIFNTYGPNMAVDDGRVVSNFIIQALRGEKLTIYGTGNQTRSFQYIDDLIDGLLKVLYGAYDQPINIGNPNEFTMNELAAEVVRGVGKHVYVKYLPLPQDDPKQRCPDISLMKKLYGWEPKIQLREGLMKTIDYFRTTDFTPTVHSGTLVLPDQFTS